MKLKKLRKLHNARLRWEDKRNQRPYIHKYQFIEYPGVENLFDPSVMSTDWAFSEIHATSSTSDSWHNVSTTSTW